MDRRTFFQAVAGLFCASALPSIPIKNDVVPVMILPGEFVIHRKYLNPYATHIQNINISVDLSRKELFELGRKAPYYRYTSYPVNTDGPKRV